MCSGTHTGFMDGYGCSWIVIEFLDFRRCSLILMFFFFTLASAIYGIIYPWCFSAVLFVSGPLRVPKRTGTYGYVWLAGGYIGTFVGLDASFRFAVFRSRFSADRLYLVMLRFGKM